MKKKIRIMQLITDLDIGGTEMMLKSLVGRLDKHKFSVVVCSIKPPGPVGKDLRDMGIRVLSLNVTNKLFLPLALFKLIDLVKTEKIDIIQSYLFADNVLSRLSSPFVKSFIVNGKRDTDRYKSFLRIFLDGLTQNMADFTVSNSKSGMDELTKRGLNKSKVDFIPSGVSLFKYGKQNRSYKKFQSKSKIRIGVIAKLRFQKGHTYLFEAFTGLLKTYPNSELVVVGDGPLKDELTKLASSLGIVDNISFLGDRMDVPNLLKTFDIFVLPSLWEGTPRALLEAMTSGLPIVATKVDGTAEVISHGKQGLLVSIKNSKQLKDSMIKLIRSPSLRKSIGSGARKKIVLEYSIKKMVQSYERLYIQLSKNSIN